MKLYYYNQLDFSDVPYNKPNGTKKNIATSGCGVASACIVFNTLAQKTLYTIRQMAEFSKSVGARTNDGTNVFKLVSKLCEKNKDFSFTTSRDVEKLINHINKGGLAICNQGDSYNVFSNGGHYVVAYDVVDGNIAVADPSNKLNKYDLYNRPKRIVKKTKYGCIVKPYYMEKATSDRYPSYYLISCKGMKKEYNPPKIEVGSVYTLTENRGVHNDYGMSSGYVPFKKLTNDGKKHAFVKNDKTYLKADTNVTIQETKILDNGNMWAKVPSGYMCIWRKSDNKLYIKLKVKIF